MLNKMVWKLFSNVDLNDKFFNSLKDDYPDFSDWFAKKANEGRKAMVMSDENGIHAFLSLKKENEKIQLVDKILPKEDRIKISTLKIDDSIGKQRLGEGIVGVALWYWQASKFNEIYVTIFPKQDKLIGLLKRFGFLEYGIKENGELVLGKSRLKIDYSNAYSSFPFLSPYAKKAGIIPIDDHFHDRLFPYSESIYSHREVEEVTAGNGITKVYIGSPYTATHYSVGDIVGIYRIFTGNGAKGNKSAITSFCTVTKVTIVKQNGYVHMPLEQYLFEAGNKTVFSENELRGIYKKSNVVMIEMTYNGFFNKGHNVTYWDLKNRNLFEDHPYNITYTIETMRQILELGGKDVKNIIID